MPTCCRLELRIRACLASKDASLSFVPRPRGRAELLRLLPFPRSCHFASKYRVSSAFPLVCA
jgi:hypothetical protein